MTETTARPVSTVSLNIAWILNTLFILASTFLLGATYGSRRALTELMPAIRQNQEQLVELQGTCDQLLSGGRHQ